MRSADAAHVPCPTFLPCGMERSSRTGAACVGGRPPRSRCGPGAPSAAEPRPRPRPGLPPRPSGMTADRSGPSRALTGSSAVLKAKSGGNAPTSEPGGCCGHSDPSAVGSLRLGTAVSIWAASRDSRQTKWAWPSSGGPALQASLRPKKLHRRAVHQDVRSARDDEVTSIHAVC